MPFCCHRYLYQRNKLQLTINRCYLFFSASSSFVIHHATMATITSSDVHKSVLNNLVSFEKLAKQTSFCLFFCFLVTVSVSEKFNTRAIVGDEDGKRVPFLILGLSLLYEIISIFRTNCNVHAARITAHIGRGK